MRCTIRAVSVAMALAVSTMVLAGSLTAQTLPRVCDPKLAKGGRGANAYTVRGTSTKWCEGVFQQEVANTELRLEAFTQRLATKRKSERRLI